MAVRSDYGTHLPPRFFVDQLLPFHHPIGVMWLRETFLYIALAVAVGCGGSHADPLAANEPDAVPPVQSVKGSNGATRRPGTTAASGDRLTGGPGVDGSPEVATDESRTSQCNRLIDPINAFQKAIKLDGSEPEDMEMLSLILSGVAQRVGTLEFADRKLQKLRDDYALMAAQLAKALNDMAVAIRKKDLETIRAATRAMEGFEEREDDLVDLINGYCLSKTKSEV